MMPCGLKLRPSTLPVELYLNCSLFTIISVVFLRLIGMIVNLFGFVYIFHLFSNALICSIACTVFLATNLWLKSVNAICEISSANAIYSVDGVGSGRSLVYKL